METRRREWDPGAPAVEFVDMGVRVDLGQGPRQEDDAVDDRGHHPVDDIVTAGGTAGPAGGGGHLRPPAAQAVRLALARRGGPAPKGGGVHRDVAAADHPLRPYGRIGPHVPGVR